LFGPVTVAFLLGWLRCGAEFTIDGGWTTQ
jgi:hypothetical protein